MMCCFKVNSRIRVGLCYAAFTHNGFDDQERNLACVKTNFRVLKLKFHACNFKQAFYPTRPASSLVVPLGKALNGIASTYEWLDWFSWSRYLDK